MPSITNNCETALAESTTGGTARPIRTLTFASWCNTLLLLAGLLGLVIAIGVLFGSESLNWSAVFSEHSDVDHDIFFLSRLPHVLLAAVVGMGLSSAGASFQGLLRNPLADPFILGVSSGAALAGVLSLALGIGFPWLTLTSFGGALLAMALVYGLATYRRRANPETLLLTGVVFNAFAYAFILFVNAIATIDQSHRILFMLIGTLDTVRYSDLMMVGLMVLAGLILLTLEGRPLNLLSEGTSSAQALGIDPARHQRRIFVASSLMVGAVVSLSGLIGFVGLFVPHIVRRIWGPDHRLLIPASALVGGGLLILCDLLARTIGFETGFSGQLPVGAITALFGAPFFLVLLRKLR